VISPIAGIVFNIILITIASILCVIPRIIYELKIMPYEVSDMTSFDDIRHSYARYNFYADQHLIPFIFGVIAGYLIRNETKQKLILINRMSMQVILWLLSILMIISAIIWTENLDDTAFAANYKSLVYWLPFTKIMWSSAIVWFIYALCTGRVG
jgi:hypothetical protein